MEIEVLLFAAARQTAGRESVRVEVCDRPHASDVLEALRTRLPEISGLLPSCRLAVDCEYVCADAEIATAAEVALIPPVSGG